MQMNLFFSVHSVAWVPLVPTHLCQEGEGEKHTCVEEILARGTEPSRLEKLYKDASCSCGRLPSRLQSSKT